MRALFVVLLLFISAPVYAGLIGEPSTREEFELFWKDYTVALKDAASNPAAADAALLKFVDFPFTTRGNMDFDPEMTYTPETFRHVLPQLLASDVGTTELPTPMSEYLMQPLTFSDSDILAGDIHAGNFKFHKVRGVWKWYYAYYDSMSTIQNPAPSIPQNP